MSILLPHFEFSNLAHFQIEAVVQRDLRTQVKTEYGKGTSFDKAWNYTQMEVSVSISFHFLVGCCVDLIEIMLLQRYC